MKLNITALALGSLLAGCADDPPPPQPAPPPPLATSPAPAPAPTTRLDLEIRAGGALNPDTRGRPSPILVRIYQLKSAAAFGQADFFDLYQRDRQILAADLVQRQELLLRPGETRRLDLDAGPEVQVVGVMGAFRNLATARWRAAAPVKAHQSNPIRVDLSGNQLALTATGAPGGMP